ncbi:MAG TPA: hypothetical protein VNT53_10365 [Pseudolysinimonas sp.]|nr:hypothetical protein [Pseudolysinimonas sp.]
MSVAPILIRALRDGGIFAALVALVGSVIGLLADGSRGLAGGLIGAALAALFLGLTAVSMLVAARVSGGDLGGPVFFGIVLGAWALKLIVFFVFALWLRTQDWLNPYVFFGTVVFAVIGSLVLDALAYQRSRVPYVDVTLPEDLPSTTSGEKGGPKT